MEVVELKAKLPPVAPSAGGVGLACCCDKVGK
ncbi:MAG: hypothetical protein XD43_0181 [Thermococcales archaeon 44_46]|nr:MAG: hypothetical protein XD43_0181 [Thermococcales archaeon 44_46]MDK2782680.1 hypothetical protein [Thermococcaceae archaeon]